MAAKKKFRDTRALTPVPAKPLLLIHPTVMLDIAEVNPAVYNPRRIDPEKFEGLKQSILEFGFYHPIVVQKKGMIICAGHQRVKALREICIELGIALPKIPAIVLDLTDRQAKKINLLDNNLHGEFDPRKLGEVLLSMDEDEKLKPTEIKLMGFEQDQADKLLRLVRPEEIRIERPSTFGRSVTLSIEFTDTRLRDAVKKSLVEKAETAKKKTGDLVASIFGVTVKE